VVEHFTIDERRARLGVRHHLAARAATPVEATRGVVALHATDPASVYLSAVARVDDGTVGEVERALYDERALVRLLGMRRTMFVVEAELVPVVLASSTRGLVSGERRKAVQFLEEGGVTDDGERWLGQVFADTLAALRARGQASAAELAEDVPALREELVFNPGKRYEARQRMTSRVLFLLAAEGRIVRGRPTGTWISSQYRWSPVETWLPGGVPELDTAAAQAELARRWLARFGPAIPADLKWWTGWTMRDARRALEAIGAVEVDLGGTAGVVLSGDLEPVAPPDPWVALLPALDPTAMGWTEREWYLGEHRAALFDRSGNIGPTVWQDGRIVGGWAQRKDGEIAVRLLSDVGAEAADAIAAEAAGLAELFGDVRATPRFRTPLERELTAA
jgi:hypothetical protein